MQVSDDSLTEGYSTAKFHPDGMLLGTGTRNSLVRIWEIRQQKVGTHPHSSVRIDIVDFGPAAMILTGYRSWKFPRPSSFKATQRLE